MWINKVRNVNLPIWVDLILINGFAIVLILVVLLVPGCGTGIGNPTGASVPSGSSIAELNFEDPINEYQTVDFGPSTTEGIDCGSFSGTSSIAEVDAGRQCIRDALTACLPAKYLFDETTLDQKHLVSFVKVELTELVSPACQLRVHTVSDDPDRFVGDITKTCASLEVDEILELACGVVQ